ncbi:hypothetical protein WICMUC_004497 [Wickerhamomyces mucosus]|uniref:RING-type domain-containing protein n=1 Tax=Wickerhamomyces mucosus TaxID=1378264 RepID=A0A9P8TB38_9ASCO|nr:hypothetical protein WICMUC_004497 [Wickerhamomyces mucosus]
MEGHHNDHDHEDCAICLEDLFKTPHELITKLQPCGHYYHTDCINLWKAKSNSCPTCRNDYDLIQMIDKNGDLISSNFANKIDIPYVEEYFFESNDEDEFLDEDIERRINLSISISSSCILCDNSHSSNRKTSCNSCSSTFHLDCLGLSTLSYWCCPMCDADNMNYERPSIFRRSRNSARTNRVYNNNKRDLLNIIQSAASNNVVVPIIPVISPEEKKVWDCFERARAQNDVAENQLSIPEPSSIPLSLLSSSSSSNVEQHSNQETRKLKQPTRRNRGPRTQPIPNEIPRLEIDHSKPSLINQILGQIKENSTSSSRKSLEIQQQLSPNFFKNHPSLAIKPLSLNDSSPTSSSASLVSQSSSSIPTSPEDNDIFGSPTTTNNKSIWKMSLSNNNELTLEQKSELQKIVRNKLRPFYKDKTITEDQYTNINKKISHILYDLVLNNNEVNLDFDKIAQYHVNREILEL